MASLETSSENTYYAGVNPPTGDYNDMVNKPAIGGVELSSTTTKADLGLDTIYNYKGQKPTYNDLPKSGNHIGDVWNVADTGENYAWNEENKWDCLTGADAVYYRNGKLESTGVTLSIDADKNTISNIETEDLKSGVLQTTVRAISSASDTSLASEKAIRTELNTKQDTIDSNHKLSSDLVDDTNATNLFVTSTEKSTWSGKQDAINDLETIRSGAAAGATAVQSIATGSTNGTISVDGSEVAVAGLGSAAYTNSTDYATSSQGALADSALQSGDLKTVNGQSVVGSGDIVITTNYSFDNSWTTNTTMSAFLNDVYTDVKAIPGMTYIGELTCSDLPTGLNNAEAVVEVMPSATAASKALHVVITSGNLDPYRWELTYWVIGSTPHNSGWIAFQPKLTQGTGITISNNTISTDALRNVGTGGANGLVIYSSNTAVGQEAVAIGYHSKMTNSRGVAIGSEAQATGLGGIAIGYVSRASGTNSIGILGQATANGSLIIGYGSNNEANTFKVALTSSTTRATNESTGLYTLLQSNGTIPIARLGATSGDTNKYLKGDGTWAEVSGGSGGISGTTPPTIATVGELGQIYVDTVANEGYVCTSIDDTDPNDVEYHWKRITYTPTSTTITLLSSNWNTTTKEYTIPVVGLLATTTVWLAPTISSDNTNEELYATYGVRGKAQANGSITLGCNTVPPVNISVELII